MKKKIIIFVVAYILTTILLMLSSCGGNDEELIPETETVAPTPPQVSVDSWIEPYHIKGGKTNDVKIFMASRMKDLTLSELSSETSVHLVYSKKGSAEGIMYSFSAVDGGLYSVVDTEDVSNISNVLSVLRKNYISVMTTNDEYMFTTKTYDMNISVFKESNTCFNVTYTFITT